MTVGGIINYHKELGYEEGQEACRVEGLAEGHAQSHVAGIKYRSKPAVKSYTMEEFMQKIR